VEIAIEEINVNGGVHGREVVLRTFDDASDVTQSRLIAQKIVEAPEIVAVVGHFNSYATLTNAATYQYAGVLLPETVAQSILQTKGWEGVTGIHNFDAYGDISSLKLTLIEVLEEQFNFLRMLTLEEKK
jgi:ABC-type branched-subunit amino acid transport system substrate-binding protein